MTEISCAPKQVPDKHAIELANRAGKINVVNKALSQSVDVVDPQRIAVLTSKYFGERPRVLSVSFMNSATNAFKNKIIEYANRWDCGVTFKLTSGIGQVRISTGSGGYWSYLGTDVLSIPRSRPTMNLQGFTTSTRESEWKRVVYHEFGHTLGFPHEHMRKEIIKRIDPVKAYDYFRRTSGWSRSTVNSQVLTPLEDSALISTDTDQTSIMCYQMPASITKDGKPIIGGSDLNSSDLNFADQIYPKAIPDEPTDPIDDEGNEEIEPLPDGDEWDDNYRQINWS